jgi:hypothetical protein
VVVRCCTQPLTTLDGMMWISCRWCTGVRREWLLKAIRSLHCGRCRGRKRES